MLNGLHKPYRAMREMHAGAWWHIEGSVEPPLTTLCALGIALDALSIRRRIPDGEAICLHCLNEDIERMKRVDAGLVLDVVRARYAEVDRRRQSRHAGSVKS